MLNLPSNKIKDNFDYRFNIIILGTRFSGKTSIVRRYINDTFTGQHTLLIGYVREDKILEINNKLVKLDIYDKYNPSYRFATLSKTYYKSRDSAIIVCNLFEDAYYDVEGIIKEIKSNADPETQIIIFVNKCDLEYDIKAKEEIKKLADKYNIKYFEVSAKTGYNINEGFNALINDMLAEWENFSKRIIELENSDEKSKKYKKCAK